eukprot:jgi/Mesvir1/19995/Mv13252-RA.1
MTVTAVTVIAQPALPYKKKLSILGGKGGNGKTCSQARRGKLKALGVNPELWVTEDEVTGKKHIPHPPCELAAAEKAETGCDDATIWDLLRADPSNVVRLGARFRKDGYTLSTAERREAQLLLLKLAFPHASYVPQHGLQSYW